MPVEAEHTDVFAETRIRTSHQSEDEIVAGLRRKRYTGSLSLNFSQGRVVDVLIRQRTAIGEAKPSRGMLTSET